MNVNHTSAFGPEVLAQLCVAFDRAWDHVKDSTTEANRERTREFMGKAIIGLAKTGYRDPKHLANYGAYQGKLFIDLRG